MTDFNVTAAYDKPAYAKGEPMVLGITGNAVETVITQEQANIALQLQSANGSTSAINALGVTVTTTTPTDRDVKIVGVTDPSGRAWTISADGKSASANA